MLLGEIALVEEDGLGFGEQSEAIFGLGGGYFVRDLLRSFAEAYCLTSLDGDWLAGNLSYRQFSLGLCLLILG